MGVAGIILEGTTFTVTVAVTWHVPIEYVMVADPAETPVTVPDVPTVATAVLLLVHTPPPTPLVSIADEPTHTDDDTGEIAVGVVSTVTILVAEQPFTVYDIAAVPAVIPVTVPVLPTVATPVAPLLHVPPGVGSVSDAVAPTQILTVPGLMAEGLGLTVTVAVTKQVPVV